MNLNEIVKASNLELAESQSILEKFGNYEQIAKEWEVQYKTIVVTDSSQTIQMAVAREARKKFSQLRIDVEKARKAMKEQSLRKGQAIDAIARFLTSLITPIEDHLRLQEDFVKIQEEKKAEEARVAAEKKAEEERVAKEKAESEERERIQLENEKLKKEAEERERILAEEREKARKEREAAELEKKRIESEQQKKLDAERKERERVEAELQAKKDEEARIKREAEEAEKKRLADIEAAKKAELKKSDKEKYVAYIQKLMEVQKPELQDLEYQAKVTKIYDFLVRESL